MFRKIACFCNVSVIAICVCLSLLLFCAALAFLPSVFAGSSSEESYCFLEGCQEEWKGCFVVIRGMKMGIMQSSTELPAP